MAIRICTSLISLGSRVNKGSTCEGAVRRDDDVDPGRRDVHARQLVHDFVDLHDDHPVVEGRRLDDGRRVLGIRAGVEVALAVGLLGTDQRHVGHQVDEHPRVQLDIGVNGADFELAVFEELCQAHALRTGESEIELAGDAAARTASDVPAG